MVSTGRRERTFVGSQCAVCEEPLEHMLRGERILHLSCGHTSHEACFYEYIREFEAEDCPKCNAPLAFDTSRGGNIDFQNLNKLVQAARQSDGGDRRREAQSQPEQWNEAHSRQAQQQQSSRNSQPPSRVSREHLLPEQVANNGRRHEQPFHGHGHGQNPHERNISIDSVVTQVTVAPNKALRDDGEEPSHNDSGRRHDYDVQSMETSLSSPRSLARNPIPAPIVTIRSEFPTVTKSKSQQSLTCLVTIEVVDGRWRLCPEDMRASPQTHRGHAEGSHPPPKPEPKVLVAVERPRDRVSRDMNALGDAKQDLFNRVDNWHGLDVSRFGRLILYGSVRVGKDRQAWQDLECYLFSEMLICVKDKKVPLDNGKMQVTQGGQQIPTRFTLKGSILIKKHLKSVELVPDSDVLTLSLSVVELPAFHLEFRSRQELELWRKALNNIDQVDPLQRSHPDAQVEQAHSEDGFSNGTPRDDKRHSSMFSSSNGAPHSLGTTPTEYSNTPLTGHDAQSSISSLHVPLDIVVVVPVSSSTQGLKINLLRDTLRFLVSSLGERDRMGLVTFGSGSGGGIPVVGMTTKNWSGWSKALENIRPIGLKSMRADVVEGANVALDLLLQRKSSNPLSHVIVISDAATAEVESVNFVVSRAEAAKIAIHSFGLGLTHKPDAMVELSTRTKASYTYVKDWMMLRECVAGCIGSLQSTSHQNAKLKLRLPEGSPGKFVKISGALSFTKRASGRDAEAILGDLRFGDKRDILVQLAVQPESAGNDSLLSDPWENMISGLEALGPIDQDDARHASMEEIPLLQADLSWGDIVREGALSQMPRPSLLAISMLPVSQKTASTARPTTPPIPPHPSVVQRRMELLTSDMLSRSLNLVARGQHDRAQHLLTETRSILKGLGKGGLPPLPTPPPERALPPTPPPPQTPRQVDSRRGSPVEPPLTALPQPPTSQPIRRTPSPIRPESIQRLTPSAGIDPTTMTALDTELESALEWILHPAIFGRDSRKAVLQAISVIGSQRGFTFRTPAETLWAARVPGIRRVIQKSREWRDTDESLQEE